MNGSAAVMAGLLLAIAPWTGRAQAEPPHRIQRTDSERVLSPVSFKDQRGATVQMPDGRVWIVTFFYGTCTTACPQLLHSLAQLQEELPEPERARVAMAAITFDPGRDTPDRLAALARDHGLDGPNVHVLRGDRAATQAAIGACGFDYQPDRTGGFRHVNLVALIDGKGRVRRHFYGLQPDLARMVAAIRDLTP